MASFCRVDSPHGRPRDFTATSIRPMYPTWSWAADADPGSGNVLAHHRPCVGSGLPGWLGWVVGREFGVLGAFVCANLAFAIGWFYSRKFVRDHLD